MNIKLSLILLLFSYTSFGAVLIPKSYSSPKHKKIVDLITKSFYDELYDLVKDLKPSEEVKKANVSLNGGKRGKMIIEEMKRKNRERLAKMRGYDPKDIKSGEDLVNVQKQDNKDLLKKIRDKQKALSDLRQDSESWQKEAQAEIDALKKKIIAEHTAWRKKYSQELLNWKRDKLEFEGDVDKYKDTLIDIPLVLPVDEKDLKKDIQVKIKKEFQIVSSSLTGEIRNQKFRPTCAAFSGVRQIDTLLQQNRRDMDLSEQFFYWASKPNCQTSQCDSKGSWVGKGYQYSLNQSSLNLSLEKDCPYSPISKAGNETQIPLKKSCFQGKVKVKNFSYLKTLDEVINAINRNKTVFASVTLSPNFYNAKSIVMNKNKNISKKRMDSHAVGHALLLIGYIKLPKILNEGEVCFVTANSWGEGWGTGGTSCLTEKWLLEQRKSNPFVVLEEVEV